MEYISYGYPSFIVFTFICCTGISGNIYDVFVKPYFMDAYRPVKRGDRFMSRRAMKSVEFKIVEVEPPSFQLKV